VSSLLPLRKRKNYVDTPYSMIIRSLLLDTVLWGGRAGHCKKGLREADGADDTYTASIAESRPLVQKLTALPELLQKQQEQKTNKKSWYLVGKTIITCHYTQEDHNQI